MPEIQTKRITLLWTMEGKAPEWIFSGDLDSDPAPVPLDRHRLTIDSASAVIEVNLHPDSTQGADFDLRPVAWRGARPSCMGVGRCRSGRRLLITDVNEKNAEHGFRVRIAYEGRTYLSPDPTILNTEPTYLGHQPAQPEAERRFKEGALQVV
ncbi:MAG: hypothetical protein ABJC13_16255 [Acidobacteriota bacterium]